MLVPTLRWHRRVMTLVVGGTMTLVASPALAQIHREASISVGRSALNATGSSAACGGDEPSPSGAMAAEARVGLVLPARWRWWSVDAGLARTGAEFPVGYLQDGRVRVLSVQSTAWLGVGQRRARWTPFAALGTGAVWRASWRYTEDPPFCPEGAECDEREREVTPVRMRAGDVVVTGALGLHHGTRRERVALEGRQGLFTAFLPGSVGPYYRTTLLQLTYTRGW